MVEVWFRLLRDHVPDLGQHCRACSGAHFTAWPCAVRTLAEEARQQHAVGLTIRRTQLRGRLGRTSALTLREREFLQMAADGRSDVEIAEKLGVPERTVRTTTRRIVHRSGARDRAALLVLALREGVIV